MIIQIIGWYCLICATVIVLALLISNEEEIKSNKRMYANFMSIGYLAIGVWCFK